MRTTVVFVRSSLRPRLEHVGRVRRRRRRSPPPSRTRRSSDAGSSRTGAASAAARAARVRGMRRRRTRGGRRGSARRRRPGTAAGDGIDSCGETSTSAPTCRSSRPSQSVSSASGLPPAHAPVPMWRISRLPAGVQPVLALDDVGDDPRVGHRGGQPPDDVEAERRRAVEDAGAHVERVVGDDGAGHLADASRVLRLPSAACRSRSASSASSPASTSAGPALHVSYLTRELDRIGYETTLVAGRVGEGEGSMEWVAEELGVHPVYLRSLQREISPVRRTPPRCSQLAAADPASPAGRSSTRTRRRPGRSVASRRCSPGRRGRGSSSTRSTATSCAATSRRRRRWLFRLVERSPRAEQRRADRRVAGGARRPRRARRRAAGEDRRDPARARPRARLGGARTRRERVRAELGVPDEPLLVGWLGRMTEIKRVDDLLRAFADSRASADADLLLVGDGPLRPGLEALAAELGIRDRCHFIGFRTTSAQFYAACDVVALTLGERGHAGHGDRGAGGRAAGRLDRRRRRPRHRRRRRSGFVVRAGRRRRASPSGSAGSPRDPELRRRLGEAGRGARRALLRPPARRRRRPASTASCSTRRSPRAARCRCRAQPLPPRAARRRDRPTRRAPPARHPRLAVLPARDRRDAVADAGVRGVPRRRAATT